MVLWKCVYCSAITSEVNISNIFCNWKKWDGSFGRLANKVVFFNQPWDWFLVVFKPLIVRKLSVWKWPSGKKIILILSDFPETSHLSCSCSLCIICWTLWERSQRGILVKEQAFLKIIYTTTTIHKLSSLSSPFSSLKKESVFLQTRCSQRLTRIILAS